MTSASLREPEEHFRRLIENASDLIQVVRLDGSIEYTSPSVERLLGYTPNELAGSPATAFMHPEDLGAVQAALFRAFSEPGITVRAQYRVRHRDGSWRWYEGTGHALGSENAELRVVANARDVTERVEAERAVRKAKARAEASLAELREAQARLIKQEKLAGLGRMAAGIAHELMNPLNFVTNFADLATDAVSELRDAIGSGDQEEIEAVLMDLRENAERIAEHSRRATETVRSMMQHAQIRVGTPRSARLNRVVEEYVALALQSARSRGLASGSSVHLALDPRVGRVRVVPEDIGRVVVNVVTNALEAAESGVEPVVTVSTQRNGLVVVLQVEDEGPGLVQVDASQLFEPFYTTRPTGRGNVGLGLSISRDIVEGHYGGSISLKGRDGGGSVCTVVLPAPAVPLVEEDVDR